MITQESSQWHSSSVIAACPPASQLFILCPSGIEYTQTSCFSALLVLGQLNFYSIFLRCKLYTIKIPLYKCLDGFFHLEFLYIYMKLNAQNHRSQNVEWESHIFKNIEIQNQQQKIKISRN